MITMSRIIKSLFLVFGILTASAFAGDGDKAPINSDDTATTMLEEDINQAHTCTLEILTFRNQPEISEMLLQCLDNFDLEDPCKPIDACITYARELNAAIPEECATYKAEADLPSMQFKPCPEQPLSDKAKGDDTKNNENNTPNTTTNSSSSGSSVQVVAGLSVIVSMLLMS